MNSIVFMSIVSFVNHKWVPKVFNNTRLLLEDLWLKLLLHDNIFRIVKNTYKFCNYKKYILAAKNMLLWNQNCFLYFYWLRRCINYLNPWSFWKFSLTYFENLYFFIQYLASPEKCVSLRGLKRTTQSLRHYKFSIVKFQDSSY